MCPTMRKLKYYLQIIKYEILFMVCGIRGFFEDLFAKNQCNLEWMEKLPANWNRDCVAVVTGGARGIGYEVSKLLLANGVKVVIGCRDVSKAEMLFQDYGQLAVPLALDLSDLKSVRKFAELVQAKFTKINLLINNAGIMFPEFIETKDGFESQLAINYLGHCLLVHCLLPQLKRSGDESEFDSRIVNVSSLAHRATSRKFRPEHLVQSKREWFLTAAGYADTKFAQILFTYYLQKRFHADRLPIEAVSVHPGVVNTGIFDNHYMKKMGGWAFRVLKSPEQGAYSVLYAALYQPLAKPGLFYIKNCSSKKPSSSLTYSESLQNQLFDFTTTKLLKINDFFNV